MSKEKKKPILNELKAFYAAPEFSLRSNRELVIEGSRGVLEYSPETIRVNTADFVLTVEGRELNLKCISASALIIEGYMTQLSFAG